MKNKRKKIAYITGTRADFGLMTPVLKEIQASSRLSLQIFVTGIHLMRAFGDTKKEVKKMFPDAVMIPSIFLSDDSAGMARFTGAYLPRVISAFRRFRPDIVLLLGDRPEMLVSALACLYLRIPVAHVHGGDKTRTVDEIARHAITKLSHLHFPATLAAARRIEKMGEEKWRIHTVGAPALDAILHEKLPSRKDVYRFLRCDESQPFMMVTQHPVSDRAARAGEEMRETLDAVKKFHLPVVVVYPHADDGGKRIIAEILRERRNPLFHIFPSIEYRMFLGIEREAAAWVGNSSAAMIESASFHTPVVNVGDRQEGREHGKNVITVPHDRKKIIAAIQKSLYDTRYRARLRSVTNPWGDGNTAPRIRRILEHVTIDSRLLNKQITY
ncbi:MAG: UDP-N-acetylglucosamine 2-epimerase [Patescibacteria group bacterium]